MTTAEEILAIIDRAVLAAFGKEPGVALTLETPPSVDLGDFAVGCFPLAKALGHSPAAIAAALAPAIADPLIARAAAAGPYINLTLDAAAFFSRAFAAVRPAPAGADTVMVEYLSPNTNKPLHLGHVRNGCLGVAVANLLEYTGRRVIRAELINDRGIHIMKSMLAWQRWGNGETPESTGEKGDHFVGRWYVRYAQEEAADATLKDEAQRMLRRWEDGDPDLVALWERMNGWVYAGFAATCERLGFRFDLVDRESETYMRGKAIVEEGVARGVFDRNADGSVTFTLPEAEFGRDENGAPKRLTLLRADGTSVYITQDIGTAHERFEAHALKRLVYVVGSEQIYHFQTLAAVMRALGRQEWADGIKHLAYGMVYLPDGKMKSREGKVVDADDLAASMVALAAAAVAARHAGRLTDAETAQRAEAIGIGALTFHMLKTGAKQDMHFDPNESISFDGTTGPYCQYAYARIKSVLAKAPAGAADAPDLGVLGANADERLLARELIRFNERAAAAAETLNPSAFLNHVYDLAKAFNQFYHRHQIINAESPALAAARLALLAAVADGLKTGLDLLNIKTLEQM